MLGICAVLQFRINYSGFKKGKNIVIKTLAYRGAFPSENVNNNLERIVTIRPKIVTYITITPLFHGEIKL